MNLIRNSALAMCIFSVSAHAHQFNLAITAINNESDMSIVVGRKEIAPEHHSDALSLPIPFIPLEKHHDAFIQGLPYFPENILIIKVGYARWGIWEEERGIVCAVHPEDYAHFDHHIPGKVLKRSFNKTKPCSSNSAKKVLLLLKVLKDSGRHKPLIAEIVEEK